MPPADTKALDDSNAAAAADKPPPEWKDLLGLTDAQAFEVPPQRTPMEPAYVHMSWPAVGTCLFPCGMAYRMNRPMSSWYGL